MLLPSPSWSLRWFSVINASKFPAVTWRVEQTLHTDGRQTLLLRVRGDAESEGCATCRKQRTVAIRLSDGRMADQELVAHGRCWDGERPLAITLGIPDTVLNGSQRTLI